MKVKPEISCPVTLHFMRSKPPVRLVCAIAHSAAATGVRAARKTAQRDRERGEKVTGLTCRGSRWLRLRRWREEVSGLDAARRICAGSKLFFSCGGREDATDPSLTWQVKEGGRSSCLSEGRLAPCRDTKTHPLITDREGGSESDRARSGTHAP